MLNSRFVCAVIGKVLKRRKSVLTLFLVVFQIDKIKKSDRQDKSPITTFCCSIVLYDITIRRSTSEYFTIKGCSLNLYDRVIKCHDSHDGMSANPSMSQHLNNNMPGNVFNVHAYVSIDAKLFTCKIRTYDIKHFFRHTPQCVCSECISTTLIDFPFVDFSQYTPWLTQSNESLVASWDSSFSFFNFIFHSSSKDLPDQLQAGMSSLWIPIMMLRNRRN